MILITGGAGYIGSHCAMALLEKGEDIVIFDSLELGHAEIIEVLKKSGNVKFVQGNLKNLDDIRGAFLVNKIDAVVHFAAYSQVAESVKNPQKYYYNNVYGTLNLLNAMMEFGVNKIVFSSEVNSSAKYLFRQFSIYTVLFYQRTIISINTPKKYR